MAPRDRVGTACRKKRTESKWLSPCFLAFLLAVFAGAVSAQARGGLLGIVTNAEGLELEAVKVLIEGSDGISETTTDARGYFSFNAVKPGTYRLRVRSDGYSEANYSPLTIRVGRPTNVRVQLAETVDEVLVVATEPAAAAPEPGSKIILGGGVERIATNRDPFSALERVPGVAVVATHGNARVQGPGADASENVYYVDGLEGDGAPGAMPSSSRLQIIQGGADVTAPSPGVIINLTTPSGGPKHRADIEASYADSSARPRSFDDIALGSGGLDAGGPEPGQVDEIINWGFDAGASLFDDRMWIWGAFNRHELRGQAVGGGIQTGELEHGALKLSGALTQSNTLSLSGHHSERRHSGVGAAPDRGEGAIQTDYSPSTWLKLEDTQQIANDLLVTWQFGITEDALTLEPLGNGEILLDESGVWQGGWLERREEIDATTLQTDVAWAHSLGRGDHEIRVGFSRRASESTRLETWGDQNLLILAGENYGTPFDLVRLHRPADLDLERDLDAGWLQDRVTFSGTTDWTVDFGLRYERQAGHALGGEAASHPLFPDLLPAVTQASTESLRFEDLLPRFGAAWAPGGSWAPTVRFGWSRFAGRLRDDLLERISPLSGAELLLAFDDLNQDNRFDRSEPFQILNRQGFDAFNSSAAGESPDPGLRSELTDEWRFGLEARPAPTLELRVDVVRREISRVFDSRRLLRDENGTIRLADVSDYRFSSLYSGYLPDGTPYSVPVYSLASGLELTGASLIQNGDRRQIYDAVTLGITRRLSRGFMLRAHATWSDWSWRVSNTFAAFDDPTNTAVGDLDGVDDDGAVVTGRGVDDRWVNSRWSFDIFALVQVAPNARWGFDLSTHVHGREGYPIPYSLSVISADRLREVQATPAVDSYRLEDVITVDLRLEKPLSFGASQATLALDILNILNEGNVLQRESRLSSPQAGVASATLSPRVVQFGVRWSWR